MKFEDVKIGQKFSIEGTTTYPKLRTDYGYLDIRDNIKKECKTLPWEVALID